MTYYITGGSVEIDKVDFGLISKYSWSFNNKGYAYGRVNGKKKLMHKLIGESIGIIGMIDHKNQNNKNHKRNNLRKTNYSLNGANRTKQNNNTSGYKGVYVKKNGEYRAYIRIKGITINLSECYKTVEDAARAYNIAAKRAFGEHACLNIIPGDLT